MPESIEEKDINLLERLINKLREVGLSSKYAGDEERKLSEYSQKLVTSYNQLSKSASGFEYAIRSQYKQTQATQEILKKLGKTQEEVHKITSDMISVILGEKRASEQIVKAFKEQEKTLTLLVKKEEEAVRVGKALQFQTKSLSGQFQSLTDGLSKVVGWKTALGGALGLSIGIKELGSTLAKYNRDLFESTRIAETYGESLGSVQKGIADASRKTTLSKQAFTEINKAFQEMYVGAPLATGAVADLASKLQNNLGYSAEMTAKAMQDLLSLQNRMPDAIDRVSDAIDAYSSGSGNAIQKTMALRGHLRDLGLGAQDVRKYMLMVKPPSLETKKLLGYEKTEADKVKAAQDAELATSQKLENQMKLLNKAMTQMLKIFQVIPASVIQLGASLIGVATVVPGLATVGKVLNTMRLEAMAATKAMMMLRGAASGVGAGGIISSSMVGRTPRLKGGGSQVAYDNFLNTGRQAGTSTLVDPYGNLLPDVTGTAPGTTPHVRSPVTSTARQARNARIGGGLKAGGNIVGMGIALGQITGLHEIAMGGTEAAEANEEEFQKAGIGKKIAMGFGGKGLAAATSIGARKAGELFFGKGETKEETEQYKARKEKVQSFQTGMLAQRTQALPGESLENLKEENEQRQKAAKYYYETIAIHKKSNAEYQKAVKDGNVAEQNKLELTFKQVAIKTTQREMLKTEYSSIKDSVKAEEDLVKAQALSAQKLEDEINIRSQIQDTVDRTVKMIQMSGEKLGDIKGYTENLFEKYKKAQLTRGDFEEIKKLGQMAATNVIAAQTESNALVVDAFSRMGDETNDELGKLMEQKGKKKEYAEYKIVAKEIADIEKNIEAEKGASPEGSEKLINLQKQLEVKKKLATEKDPTQGGVGDDERKVLRDKLVGQIAIINEKRKDKSLTTAQITALNDQLSPLKKVLEGESKVADARVYSADIQAELSTGQQDRDLNLLDMSEKMADAEAQRARAYNLGVHAGYDALNKQIDVQRKSIDVTKEAILIQEQRQKAALETVGMGDFDVKATPMELELALYQKMEALKKSDKAEDKQTYEKIKQDQAELIKNQEKGTGLRISLIGKETKIAELTKDVMEGYLAANKEFIANAGVFSGIIGSTKRGITQLIGKDVGAGAGKWSGVLADTSRRGVGERFPGYNVKGVFSGPGRNVTDEEANKNAKVLTNRALVLQSEESQKSLVASQQEAVAKGGGTKVIRVVPSSNKGEVGLKKTGSSKKEIRKKLVDVEDVFNYEFGGPTSSGYVISKQKTDQYRDLINMLNPSMVSGGISGKDSVPVPGVGLLMPGEAIITGDEESALAEMINKGQIQGMAGGGHITMDGSIRSNKMGGGVGFRDSSGNVQKTGNVPKSLGGARFSWGKTGGVNFAGMGKTGNVGFLRTGLQSGSDKRKKSHGLNLLDENNGIQIRHMASGGGIQVPRGIARQFASAPSSSGGGEVTLKLNPEVRDLLVVEGRKNYRSGTRIS